MCKLAFLYPGQETRKRAVVYRISEWEDVRKVADMLC